MISGSENLRLLSPIFLFFFHCYVQFDGVKANNFQRSAAITAFDNVTLISVFIYLNFGLAAGAGSSWHVLILRDYRAMCPPPRSGNLIKKYLNRNTQDLQEAGSHLPERGFW